MHLIQLEKFKKFEKIIVDVKENGLSLIAGVNNSGKTSLLHSLAVWEYAKILLINARGKECLLSNYDDTKKGFGIEPEMFSPISIPSLRYLWNRQKTAGAYELKIRVGWKDEEGNDLFVELAFNLTGNNFAVKKSASNIQADDPIPTIAYLPPFGGMSENEGWLSVADRRKLIGKGQAGSVIRNLLLDLHQNHEKVIEKRRGELFPGKQRLSQSDQKVLADISTEWRYLKDILFDVFRVNLKVHPFDSQFHNYISVDVVDLVKKDDGSDWQQDKYSRRDLMVEGSGFLQWLSVFALALDKNNDILLLDEPDAHLHSSLQSLLLEKLESICDENGKQILLVSHSSDLIKLIDYQKVLHVEPNKAGYLTSKEQKVVVLEGLGSQYFPHMDDICAFKRVILVENHSDIRVLQSLCEAIGKSWPSNLAEWVSNKTHKERKTLIVELNQKISQDTGKHIVAYSLRDLDDDNYNTTNIHLHSSGRDVQKDDSGQYDIMMYRTLRRREIENYLIIPTAISRYISGNCRNPEIPKDIEAVQKYLIEKHGLVVPDTYKNSDRESCTEGLFIKDVKPVLDGINQYFKVRFDKEDYVKSILGNEVCDDLRTIIDEIIEMCAIERE